MHITIKRFIDIDGATLGVCYVTDEQHFLRFVCNTLEPKLRKEKIKGCTAIPEGTYKVKYQYSPKFGKDMPFLQGVPNFTGVMLHIGNSLKDTEGCILVGQSKTFKEAFIYNSKYTFDLLDAILKYDKNNIVCEVINIIKPDPT